MNNSKGAQAKSAKSTPLFNVEAIASALAQNSFSEQLAKSVADALAVSNIENVPDEEEPQALYNLNGVEVLPRQSVSVVAAQKKSGKSNFAGLLMAASAHPDHQILEGALRSNEGTIKVLNLDTEQPLRDARRTLRRAMKTASYSYAEQWQAHGIYSLSIKDLLAKLERIEERLAMIEVAVISIRPDLLIIDGIADLMDSINDEGATRAILQWLDHLAVTYNCAVIGMLHLNFGSQKIGGWIGTGVLKKFTDSFLLSKSEAGYFTAKHEGRGESAPDLQFKIICPPGEKVGYWGTKEVEISPMTKEDEEELKLRTMFDKAPLPCTKKELTQWIFAETHDITKSTSKAEKLLKKAKNLGLIDSYLKGRESIYISKMDAAEQPQIFED